MCVRQYWSRLTFWIPWTHHITQRKNFRATWIQEVRQKLMKSQKFRESQSALKNKILPLTRFVRISSISTLRRVKNWCALDIPDLEQPFEYLERYHKTHRKIFRATWSQNSHQKVRQKLMKTQIQLKLSKFLWFH